MSGELRILCDLILPDQTLRLWDGAGGKFVDIDGNAYRPAQFTDEALQQVEAAINGEAYSMNLALIDIPMSVGDSVWQYDEETSINGAPFILKLQDLDAQKQPVGDPEVKFTGTINNMTVTDQAGEKESTSAVMVEAVNAFTLRVTANGQVLSDVDQKERSKRLNPAAWLAGRHDRALERVPGLRDKAIRWPNW